MLVVLLLLGGVGGGRGERAADPAGAEGLEDGLVNVAVYVCLCVQVSVCVFK